MLCSYLSKCANAITIMLLMVCASPSSASHLPGFRDSLFNGQQPSKQTQARQHQLFGSATIKWRSKCGEMLKIQTKTTMFMSVITQVEKLHSDESSVTYYSLRLQEAVYFPDNGWSVSTSSFTNICVHAPTVKTVCLETRWLVSCWPAAQDVISCLLSGQTWTTKGLIYTSDSCKDTDLSLLFHLMKLLL